MMTRLTRRRITIAIVGAGVAICPWLSAPRAARGAATSKVEVRRLDIGHSMGRAGIKIRLVLASGEALEFQTDEAAETDTILRLAETFLASRARMFAEVEGGAVRAVSLSGPNVFTPAN
jgi:hypothetical protein